MTVLGEEVLFEGWTKNSFVLLKALFEQHVTLYFILTRKFCFTVSDLWQKKCRTWFHSVFLTFGQNQEAASMSCLLQLSNECVSRVFRAMPTSI